MNSYLAYHISFFLWSRIRGFGGGSLTGFTLLNRLIHSSRLTPVKTLAFWFTRHWCSVLSGRVWLPRMQFLSLRNLFLIRYPLGRICLRGGLLMVLPSTSCVLCAEYLESSTDLFHTNDLSLSIWYAIAKWVGWV